MFFFFKNHNILIFAILLILAGCQLKEPTKNHGILFLENRSKQLTSNKNNKNDVLRLIGNPHSKSFNDENTWIYIERVLTKGSFHKLGQNVLKTNNILVLTFNKYGILKEKQFFDKSDLNKVKFSKKITENNLAKRSYLESFLSSIKSKMYSNRK
jgi:outer membrane protein assembly factor BamE (lipoprotein component of BamABCDE complex)